MPDFDKDGPREQHNYGSGTFIGRDSVNIRYETIDPKTKVVLSKLSKDAPDLARLLKTALQEGVISPEAVAALQSAVRNINEDVASALLLAGRNINEDVANSLAEAGRNINEDVADKMLRAARILDGSTSQLDHAVDRVSSGNGLDRLDGVAKILTDVTERIEYVVTPPSPVTIVNRMPVVKAFFFGIAIGIIGLMIYHAFRPF